MLHVEQVPFGATNYIATEFTRHYVRLQVTTYGKVDLGVYTNNDMLVRMAEKMDQVLQRQQLIFSENILCQTNIGEAAIDEDYVCNVTFLLSDLRMQMQRYSFKLTPEGKIVFKTEGRSDGVMALMFAVYHGSVWEERAETSEVKRLRAF